MYDAPEKRYSWLIDGGMKTSDPGVSRVESSSILESAIMNGLL